MRQPFSLFGILLLLLARPIAAQNDSSAGVNAQSPGDQPSGNRVTRRGYYGVGGAVSAPVVICAQDPEYSEEARKARREGTVVLWLIVDIDGTPHQIQVVQSPSPDLVKPAIKAVQQWRFEPSKKDAQPVAVQINVEVSFRLDRSLSSHTESAADPPRFPGVDIAEYPLVVRTSPLSAADADTRASASRQAVITEAGGQKAMTISCWAWSLYCLVPDAGTYPARWLQNGKRLEILGLDKKQTWEPAEYAVATELPSAS